MIELHSRKALVYLQILFFSTQCTLNLGVVDRLCSLDTITLPTKKAYRVGKST